VRREIIGRHAGHDLRASVGIQHEKIAVRPDIGAVLGDKDRHVPEKTQAARCGIAAQRVPLPENTNCANATASQESDPG